jgi:hypothetical protein
VVLYIIGDNVKKIYIQIGAGVGDLDARGNFRDGFTELVKGIDPATIARILLVEPNPSNIPNLQKCWKDYPQAEIYELGICLNTHQDKFIKFYYVEEDAPHFNVFSIVENHVRKHYPTQKIKTKTIPCMTLQEFLNAKIKSTDIIDVLALDIEGIDAEIILENDWNKINCRYLSLEHIHLGQYAIAVKEKLNAAGYKYNGTGLDHNNYDWSFIRQ